VSGEYQPGKQQLTTPDGIVEQGVKTQVDLDSVAQTAPWLQGLKDYVEQRLIPDAATMVLTNDLQDLYFGKVDGAKKVGTKHSSYLQAVVDSYRSVADSLGTAVKATNDIVKNYKDVEHNNTLNVAGVDKTFTDDSSGGSSASSGQSTSSTGQGSTGQQTSGDQGSF